MNLRVCVAATFVLSPFAAFQSGCSEDLAAFEDLRFELSAISPRLLTSQSWLFIDLKDRATAIDVSTHTGSYGLRLEVPSQGQVYWLTATALSSTRLLVEDLSSLSTLPTDDALFIHLEVFAAPYESTPLSSRLSTEIQWTSSLKPQLKSFAAQTGQLIPQTHLVIEGEALPFAREGELVVRLEGQFQSRSGDIKRLAPTFLPLTLSDLSELKSLPLAELRQKRKLLLSPDLFANFEGHFTGTGNLLYQGEALSQPYPLSLAVTLPYLKGHQQPSPSRGTFLHFEGPGFDQVQDAPLALEFSGTFTPKGTNAAMSVQWVSFHEGSFEQSFRFALSPALRDGALSGFGAQAGDFQGRATPLLFSAEQVHRGQAYPLELRVGPTEQHVAFRWDGAGLEALHRFGMLSAIDTLERNILALLAEHFAGLRLYPSFTSLPEHVAQAVWVQLRGPDLNGAGLLGLDTSLGKDVGNLILNETLGGFVAPSSLYPQGAFGGLFLDELWQFSPTVGASLLADVRFDSIFSASAPELGGSPLSSQASDWSPAQVMALETLAELISHTLAHELGHVLGLPASGEEAHPINDTPFNLMDAGEDRPFAERANLNSGIRTTFSPEDRRYLEEILGQP